MVCRDDKIQNEKNKRKQKEKKQKQNKRALYEDKRYVCKGLT